MVSHLAASKALSANDRLRIAVIGANGRGRDHIRGIMNQPDAEVVCLCDPDQQILDRRVAEFEKAYGKKVHTETDLRKVYDNKDIDAVTIATPNHWHSLAAIWACQAGKDVYVEKPGSHNVYEGRKMVEAAHKYKRIVQHGVQLRSSEAIREAVSLLRSGVIGDVYMARGLVFRWRPSIGNKQPEPVPAGLNYDLWTGPAQQEPFSRRFVHYNWHWTWNYGNGDVGNQGIHETDLCMWGLGVNTLPAKITLAAASSLSTRRWADPSRSRPASPSLHPDQKKMIRSKSATGAPTTKTVSALATFYGDKGYMIVNGGDTSRPSRPEERRRAPAARRRRPLCQLIKAAVRSRNVEDQNGSVETAHLSSALAHLGNISFRLRPRA